MSRVSGICLEPHAETYGMSGVEKKWEPDALKSAASTLAGCKITNSASTGPDSVVGEVLYSEYKENQGVYYEAEIVDEDVVYLLESGSARLAPRMTHESLPTGEDIVSPQDIEFDGLFVTAFPADGVPNNPD